MKIFNFRIKVTNGAGGILEILNDKGEVVETHTRTYWYDILNQNTNHPVNKFIRHSLKENKNA